MVTQSLALQVSRLDEAAKCVNGKMYCKTVPVSCFPTTYVWLVSRWVQHSGSQPLFMPAHRLENTMINFVLVTDLYQCLLLFPL